MDEDKNLDIRWKQRFKNFQRAFEIFERTIQRVKKTDGEIEKMALIQSFEFVFELGWKTMKDYLKEVGFDEVSPRGVIKKAFSSEYIKNGEMWLMALEDRNRTTHMYDQKRINDITIKIIDDYAQLFQDLNEFFVAQNK